MSEIVRVSIPLDKEINDRLNKLLPWGVKAQVLRELIALLLEAQSNHNTRYIVVDLLEGRCELRSKFEQTVTEETE